MRKKTGFTERERERERERESFIKINEKEKWVHKERERESSIKINERALFIDYLNKRCDKIDELMWVFCKSECVK